jgi:hypothetical protein
MRAANNVGNAGPHVRQTFLNDVCTFLTNIRFLPSIVAEKNATKNEHICSMCRKIIKVGKQEVGI